MPRRSPQLPIPGNGKPSGSALSVREHILDRTIFLTGKLGTTDVAIRAIAQEAGVNVAAVNYYFSSKEQMLALLAERFQSGFREVMHLLEDRSRPPEERLRRWASEVMGYLSEYPGILTLMERQLAAEPLDAFGQALRSAMQQAVKLLKANLRELVGRASIQRLTFKLTLFISTIAGPFPRHLDRGPERRGYRTPSQRAQFLDQLIAHLRQ
jgi:AcrR family transcriptional regulator